MKLTVQELRRFSPALLVLLPVLVFSVVLLREGHLRDMDLARLGSLEAATAISESLLSGDTPVFSSGAEAAVTGWGVYTVDGTGILTRGSAPESVTRNSSGAGFDELLNGDVLRTYRSMSTPRMGTASVHRSGTQTGGGSGMRRIVLTDWDMKAAGNPELPRITGVSGLVLVTVVLLSIQFRSQVRLDAYRKDEEKKRQLVQLGLAVRTLTHEIRNPLGTIRARTSLLRRSLPEEFKEDLSSIDDEVTRLNVLTEKVRDWLKDPKGNPEVFQPARAVEDIAGRLEWPIERELEEGTSAIRMDPAMFEAVLTNIIRNAVESQEDIDRPPPVSLSLRYIGKQLVIDITDRGRGLPPGEEARIYDPFFTGRTRGSGVGLSLALQAIEAADGSLVLTKRSGGGTLARITLPLEKPE